MPTHVTHVTHIMSPTHIKHVTRHTSHSTLPHHTTRHHTVTRHITHRCSGVAEVLFGQYSPSGRLPFGVATSSAQLGDITDYAMTSGYGRTYRYNRYENTTAAPLFPFCFGRSYANLSMVLPPEHQHHRHQHANMQLFSPVSFLVTSLMSFSHADAGPQTP